MNNAITILMKANKCQIGLRPLKGRSQKLQQTLQLSDAPGRNIKDILGYDPGDAPFIRSVIKPFCGTNEEIRALRCFG